MFASLLDAERGGHFRIAPDRDDYVSRQLYLPDTAVLIIRFMTADGVGEVHDFMPVTDATATGRHRLVRNASVVRGTMRFAIEIKPRFDHGRRPHELELSENGAADQSQLDVYGEALDAIWETRGSRKNFTYGRFQAWVALSPSITTPTCSTPRC